MRALSDQEKREAFFYAQGQEALVYDDVVDFTLPDYRQVHTALIALLRYHFDILGDDTVRAVRGSILDAGFGTGVEALAILATFPNVRVVGVDCNVAMLARFAEKYVACFGTTPTEDRCVLVCADLLGEAALASALRGHLPESEHHSGYRAVVSAFALHHYSEAEKKHVYRQFCAALEPGGLLLNADLFAYRSPALERYALQDTERWIVDRFGDLPLALKQRLEALGQQAASLRDAFIHHIRAYNIPLPVESRMGSESGSTGDAPGEIELLHEAGFVQVECPYRHFQSGILWARK